MNSAGTSWQTTLLTIDGSLVEYEKELLRAGVSQAALAIYFGQTATQVKSLASANADETEQLKLQEGVYAELTKATDEHYKAVNAASHDTVTAQVNDAYLVADSKIAAMYKAKTYSVAAEMEIWAAANQTANNIIQKNLESDVYSKAHYQLLADTAKNAYDRAAAEFGQHTDLELQTLRDASDKAAITLANWATAADAALKKAGLAADSTTAKLKQTTDQTAAATSALQVFQMASSVDPSKTASGDIGIDSYGNKYVKPAGASDYTSPGTGLAFRAAGGPVSAGSSYVVGERKAPSCSPRDRVASSRRMEAAAARRSWCRSSSRDPCMAERDFTSRVSAALTRQVLQGLKV